MEPKTTRSKEELIAELEKTKQERDKLSEKVKQLETLRKNDMLELSPGGSKFHNMLDEVNSIAVQGYLSDGTTTYWNKASENLYGYTATEAIGRNLLELIIPPDLQEMVRKAIVRMFETSEVIPPEELQLKHKNGHLLEVYSSHALLKKEGKPVEFFCMDIDITKRKQAETALQYALERNKAMLDANPDLIFVIDEDFYIKDYHTINEKDLYARPVDFLNKNIEAVLPESLVRLTKQKIRRVLKSGLPDIAHYSLEVSGQQQFFESRYVKSGEKEALSIVRNVTEQKRAENKLIQSEQKYKQLQQLFRNMADIMPDMLWAKDLDKNYIFANRSICENLINAKDTQEPIGKNDMFFAQRERDAHPDDPNWHSFGEICRDSDSVVLESGKTGQFDEFGNVKGRFLYLDVVKTPLRNDEGEIIGVVGTARDVTESKRAEKQLKESEARLRLAIKVAKMGYWQYDVKTQKVDWSDGHHLLFGIPADAFGGTLASVQECVHPDDRAHGEKNLKDAIEQDKPFINYYRVIHPDDSVRWMYSYGELIKDDQNKLTSIFGITRDITEQRLAEENLKLQSRFRELLMDISARFINIPLNRVNEAVNESLVMMGLFVQADRSYTFDYDWQNEVCHNTYEWCREGISAEIDNLQNVPLAMMRAWVDAHRQGKPMYVPDVFALPQGQERDILEPQGVKSVLTVPMMDQDKCIGFVGFDSVNQHHVYSDIEQQLLKIYAQLLTNIKLRIQTEKELIAAKEKAEAGDKLKTAFLQNISHEIRTPLNHIIGFSQMMIEPVENEREREQNFAHIQMGSDRLLDTITNYLDMSMLVTGNMPLNISVCEIDKVLQRLYQVFRPRCEQSHLTLHLKQADPVLKQPWLSDPELLYKLLYQILDNAVKFTFKGSIEFGYQLTDDSLRLFVHDTGKGIEPGKLKAIFEPFEQEETAMTRGYEGSGLGLSVANGIARMLGGFIRATSEKGKGSSFELILALQQKQVIKPEVAVKAPRKPTVRERPLLLVAEDDRLNFAYLKAILEKKGYEIIAAENGAQALDKYAENPEIELILMDIKMPVMDGIKCTQQLRSKGFMVPIIALTAYAETGDEQKVLAAGCNAYLSKPVSQNDLLSCIANYVKVGK